jgi:hypothetical protein
MASNIERPDPLYEDVNSFFYIDHNYTSYMVEEVSEKMVELNERNQ